MFAPVRITTPLPSPAAHDGARREHVARRLVYILRLAREGRLIDAQGSGQELHVGRDDVAGTHADDVAGHQFSGGNDLPVRVAQHAGTDLEPSPQCLHHARGTPLLCKAQNGVDNQQYAHDGEIGVMPQHERQKHDRLEHPRRQAPESFRGI